MSLTTVFTWPRASALGSLMTTFTPPSFCADAVLSGYQVYEIPTTSSDGFSTENSYTVCPYLERDVACGSYGDATYPSECFPDIPPSSPLLLYSPATACPAGHTTEALRIDDASQTTAICCPSDYSSYGISCAKAFTESTLDVIFCPGSGSPVRTSVSRSQDVKFTTLFDYVYVMQIQLVLPTSLSEISFTAPDVPTSSPSPSSDYNPDDDNTLGIPPERKEKSVLGGGLIAGIVVGAVADLALAGAAAFFWRRRKHRNVPVKRSKGSPGEEQDMLPEYVGGNGTIDGSAQTTTATSNGLFQPPPAPGSTR